jgi:general secretion pathway protein K
MSLLVVKRHRGIAVITVLLALAIAILISSEVIMRVYMGVKRSTNQMNALQAWEYALGGEEWARQRLGVDYLNDKQQHIDHFQEEWAMPAQTLEIEGGFIEIEIYDMQSRFNLNNLVDEQGKVNAKQLIIFKRLLQRLGISTVYADEAAKWASYSEDLGNEYGNEDRPYRAADTQFGSITEMRLLPEMPLDLYQRLAPFIAVLPALVKPNINTASEPVLASLAQAATPERLAAFLEQRKERKEGYSSGDAYINAMGIQDDEIQKGELGVSSDFFEIRVRAEYNERRSYLISTVYRDPETGEIRLLSRNKSERFQFENSIRDPAKPKDEENDEKSINEKSKKKLSSTKKPSGEKNSEKY